MKANVVFAQYAKALRTGEVYIIETLADHLDQSRATNANRGEARRFALPAFVEDIAPQILRGVFKPRKKAFGFEVHTSHLDDMLRIVAADCQLNYLGHEIPYLLNRVDEEMRRHFKQDILRDRIVATMAQQSEELFLEEINERTMR